MAVGNAPMLAPAPFHAAEMQLVLKNSQRTASRMTDEADPLIASPYCVCNVVEIGSQNLLEEKLDCKQCSIRIHFNSIRDVLSISSSFSDVLLNDKSKYCDVVCLHYNGFDTLATFFHRGLFVAQTKTASLTSP